MSMRILAIERDRIVDGKAVHHCHGKGVQKTQFVMGVAYCKDCDITFVATDCTESVASIYQRASAIKRSV